MLVASGDGQLASVYGGGWKSLAQGDVLAALGEARQARGNCAMRLLEAEALIAAGGIVAGLQRLEALHRAGDAAASLALARRRHLLGDHTGAEDAAAALPMHARAALIGARAALARKRIEAAMDFIEPYLEGSAHCPEPMLAGSVAVIAAAVMVRRNESERLQRFAQRLMGPELPDEMLPTAVRIAWMAGQAEDAWQRCEGDSAWMAAARMELAILAADGAKAATLVGRAGHLATPNASALLLLNGSVKSRPQDEQFERMFKAGVSMHLWRTHPLRWQPWIDAAKNTAADVKVFDLAAGAMPDPGDVPDVVVDDGSLVEVLQPAPVALRPQGIGGAWVDKSLCEGIALGLDWPDEENRVLAVLPRAKSRKEARLWVVGAEEAFAGACEGRLIVAIAPPGDPFWNGPLPEQAWSSLRVVKADAGRGWAGAGERVLAAAKELVTSIKSADS